MAVLREIHVVIATVRSANDLMLEIQLVVNFEISIGAADSAVVQLDSDLEFADFLEASDDDADVDTEASSSAARTTALDVLPWKAEAPVSRIRSAPLRTRIASMGGAWMMPRMSCRVRVTPAARWAMP